MSNPLIILAIAAAYLSGSIPFALLIGKSRGVDLRTQGSGNIGATNCGRVLGKRFGILCFALDVLKGFIPVFVAGYALGFIESDAPVTMVDQWLWLCTAAAAVLGHVFPVWLKFRGGKGAATGLGVILGIWPHLTIPAVAAFATWVVLVGVTRYVGVSSVVAALLLPIYIVIMAGFRDHPLQPLLPHIVITTAMAILLTVRHRSNIARTIAGTESRIHFRKHTAAPQETESTDSMRE